jgi:hypothetical protein
LVGEWKSLTQPKNQKILPRERSILNGHQANFDRFYAAYPKHESKGAAERAFLAAIKIAEPEILVSKAAAYAKSKADEDRKFIKQPATWLNQKCWLDEPAPKPEREAVF